MNLKEQQHYVKSHGILLPNGQVFLEKPLFVYKKIATYPKQLDATIEKSLLAGMSYNYTPGPGIAKGVLVEANLEKVRKSNKVHAIANLILPPGAMVNLPSNWNTPKMRASQAIVHSIVRIHDKKQTILGVSRWDNRHPYVSPKGLMPNHTLATNFHIPYGNRNRPNWMKTFVISPSHAYDTGTDECESGIHFFLESHQAVIYN